LVMPNFFIIGAAKAGTSSLYNYLGQHPQIFMSSVKEPNYFSYKERTEYNKGPGDRLRTQGSVSSLQDYEGLFEGAENFIVRGEASTTYLDVESAPGRIKQYVPEAKIIVILRNPVDRAYASFRHLRRDGSEPLAVFQKALQEEEKRILNKWGFMFHYKTRQFTYEKLKRYFDTFNEEKIKVYLYEDWKNDNYRVLKDIFLFLEVDDTFLPDLKKKYNKGALPKSESFHNFLVNENFIKNMIKPFIPLKLGRKIKRKLVDINLERHTPLSSLIRKEMSEIYRLDTIKVQDLIQKDLSHWLNS